MTAFAPRPTQPTGDRVAPDQPAGLLVSTPEGRVTANAGWHVLTHRVLPPGTCEGLLTAVHPDDRPAAVRALRGSDAGQVTRCDVRLISGDGSIAAAARLQVHRPAGWPPGTSVIVVVPRQSDPRWLEALSEEGAAELAQLAPGLHEDAEERRVQKGQA